jgi:hypothetical protein
VDGEQGKFEEVKRRASSPSSKKWAKVEGASKQELGEAMRWCKVDR